MTALAMATGCATTTTARLGLPPLQTVPYVDLPRYLGTWYEIASFPQSFQAGCTATTATYTLRDDGDIDVFNRPARGARVGDGPAGADAATSGELTADVGNAVATVCWPMCWSRSSPTASR